MVGFGRVSCGMGGLREVLRLVRGGDVEVSGEVRRKLLGWQSTEGRTRRRSPGWLTRGKTDVVQLGKVALRIRWKACIQYYLHILSTPAIAETTSSTQSLSRTWRETHAHVRRGSETRALITALGGARITAVSLSYHHVLPPASHSLALCCFPGCLLTW